MQNLQLAQDYIQRSRKRLFSIQTLYEHEAWPDVVRECQEVVELACKAFLRMNHIDPPRTHDVSDVLKRELATFSAEAQKVIPKIARISHSLRRDRELAYYGSEDLTPSEFYQQEDAEEALKNATWVVDSLEPFF